MIEPMEGLCQWCLLILGFYDTFEFEKLKIIISIMKPGFLVSRGVTTVRVYRDPRNLRSTTIAAAEVAIPQQLLILSGW